jgi:hypothetical protein
LVDVDEDGEVKKIFTRRSGSEIETTYLEDKFRVEWSGGTHNDLTKSATFNQWSDPLIDREHTIGHAFLQD